MPPTATVEKASILAVKRETARKRRRRETDHVAEELNIIAMMDMMTIILVFLLKSLSASANNIPQGDDLRLPHSSVNTAPSTALPVDRANRSALSLGLLHGDYQAQSKRILKEYSKGMRQRIGLAQALINDPDLVILDVIHAAVRDDLWDDATDSADSSRWEPVARLGSLSGPSYAALGERMVLGRPKLERR